MLSSQIALYVFLTKRDAHFLFWLRHKKLDFYECSKKRNSLENKFLKKKKHKWNSYSLQEQPFLFRFHVTLSFNHSEQLHITNFCLTLRDCPRLRMKLISWKTPILWTHQNVSNYLLTIQTTRQWKDIRTEPASLSGSSYAERHPISDKILLSFFILIQSPGLSVVRGSWSLEIFGTRFNSLCVRAEFLICRSTRNTRCPKRVSGIC